MATRKLSKVQVHERWLWIALIALLLILLIGFMAAYYKWGPFKPGTTTPTTSTGLTGSGSGSSGASSSGANGANGSNGSTGAAGAGSVSPAAGSDVFNLYGSVTAGEAKTQVGAQSNGIKANCLTATTSTSAGKQEVCTYTQGDRVVTVSYLNDRVVSVSKTGF